MTEPSKEARELLAAEFEAAGVVPVVAHPNEAYNVALCAIDKALSRTTTSGEDDVERVARAIFDAEYPQHASTFDCWPSDLKKRFRTSARAAIAAMREPTEGMVGDGIDGFWPIEEPEIIYPDAHADAESAIIAAWQAMIDSALSEGERE